LISIFGSTSGIAQIGALGRLMVLLMLIQNLLDLLVVPRFARMKDSSGNILLRFWQILGAVIFILVGITFMVYLIPEPILYVLGKDYSDLKYEVLLITISSCISLIAGVINRLASSRGIIPDPRYFLPFVITTQIVILLWLVDYSTVLGVLTFSIFAASLGLIYRVFHFLIYCLKKNYVR
jgi:hypothetical protein